MLYAANADWRFVSYNAFWLFLGVALVAMRLTGFRASATLLANSTRAAVTIAAILAGGWIYAYVQRDVIFAA